MHSSTLLISALAIGALALPNQLGKRKQVTVYDTVIVTVTIFVDPDGMPAWAPLSSSQAPTPTHATNAPPLVTPSLVGDSSTKASQTPVRLSSATYATSSPCSTSLAASAVSSLSSSVVDHPVSAPSVVDPIPNSSGLSSTSLPEPGPPEVVRPSSSSNAPAASSSAVPVFVPSAPAAPAAPAAEGHISGALQAYLSVGSEYQQAILYHHNTARANHGADPLVWDDAVAKTAAKAANTCKFEHYIPAGAGQGQNLFTVSGSAFNVTAGITESWYKGELPAMQPYFGQKDIPDDIFHNVGHLTQMVWKGTTKVGCVSIDCGSRMVVGGTTSTLNKYTVCNYAPAGNVAGQYAFNVGSPNGMGAAALGSWSD